MKSELAPHNNSFNSNNNSGAHNHSNAIKSNNVHSNGSSQQNGGVKSAQRKSAVHDLTQVVAEDCNKVRVKLKLNILFN